MDKILTVYDLIRELTRVPADTKLSIQLPCSDNEIDNDDYDSSNDLYYLTNSMLEITNHPQDGPEFKIDLRYIK